MAEKSQSFKKIDKEITGKCKSKKKAEKEERTQMKQKSRLQLLKRTGEIDFRKALGLVQLRDVTCGIWILSLLFSPYALNASIKAFCTSFLYLVSS